MLAPENEGKARNALLGYTECLEIMVENIRPFELK